MFSLRFCRFCKTESRGRGVTREAEDGGVGDALEGGGRVQSQGFGRMLEKAGKQVSRGLRTPLGPLLDFSPLGSLDL